MRQLRASRNRFAGVSCDTSILGSVARRGNSDAERLAECFLGGKTLGQKTCRVCCFVSLPVRPVPEAFPVHARHGVRRASKRATATMSVPMPTIIWSKRLRLAHQTFHFTYRFTQANKNGATDNGVADVQFANTG